MRRNFAATGWKYARHTLTRVFNCVEGMAFCFKRKESVARAIRRLGCERIESALECLKQSGRAEAIHGARKDIKKVRALLRVTRANISRKDFRSITRLLRQAANRLAPARDACVKARTLSKLVSHFKGKITPGALRHLQGKLRSAANDEMKRFQEEKHAKSAERNLRRVAKAFEDLKLNARGWQAIGAGIKLAYRQGREASRKVLKNPSPTDFHEWRKRAKDLWYQVSLLRPVWPEQMDAMASELETLGECLGDDHDLFVLQEAAREDCARNGDNREFELLLGLIETRQCELRIQATKLGKRFYAESPVIFCERLATYWHTWRREKGPPISSPRAAP